MARELRVEIVGDASSLEKALGKAGKASSSFGDKVKKGAAIAGAAIGGGLAVAAKIGWDEFKQGQLVAAQTNAVLKSTGGVANVTAEGLDKLAGSMMKKTGIDDEAIASGSNMLLTFTQIRNEVGKGNDIFDQATRTLADMSVATGQAMPKAAVMLGKALNDPLKGLSKLTKIGVTFTDAQKAQVEAMVKAGNTAGAQKVILKELNREFGGSAEAAGKTLPGQINILKESFSNFAGELVAKVIPKIVAIIGFFRDHTTIAKVLGGVIAGTVGILIAAGAAMKVYGAVTAVTTAFKWLFVTAVNAETGAVTRASFASKIAAGATKAWAATQWLLNAALAANPIGLVVLALAALVVGLVIAWKKSETFREIVTGAWEAIKGVAVAVFDKVREVVGDAINFMVDLVSKHPLVWLITHFGEVKDKVGEFIGAIPGAIAGLFEEVFGKAKELGGRLKSGAVDGITGLAGLIWEKVKAIPASWLESASTIVGWGKDLGTWLKNAVVDGVTGLAGLVWDKVNNIGSFLLEKVAAVKGWGSDLGTWLKNAVPEAIVGIASAVWDKVNNVWEFLKDKADAIKGWGERIGGWLKDAIVDGLGGLAGAIWEKMKDELFSTKGSLLNRIKGSGGGGGPSGREPIPSQGPVGTGPLDISSKLWDELALGRRMGLYMSSGYRPGDDGDHGKYPSHAIDMVGSQMSDFATAMYGRLGIKDVIFGHHPFWQDNGRIVSWAGFEQLRRDHAGSNAHVHASVFDRGGVLATGLNLIGNFTGRPEPLVPAVSARGGGDEVTVNVHVHGSLVHEREVGPYVIRAVKEAVRDGFDMKTSSDWAPGFS
jgi:phage-related protein